MGDTPLFLHLLLHHHHHVFLICSSHVLVSTSCVWWGSRKLSFFQHGIRCAKDVELDFCCCFLACLISSDGMNTWRSFNLAQSWFPSGFFWTEWAAGEWQPGSRMLERFTDVCCQWLTPPVQLRPFYGVHLLGLQTPRCVQCPAQAAAVPESSAALLKNSPWHRMQVQSFISTEYHEVIWQWF